MIFCERCELLNWLQYRVMRAGLHRKHEPGAPSHVAIVREAKYVLRQMRTLRRSAWTKLLGLSPWSRLVIWADREAKRWAELKRGCADCQQSHS